MDSLCSREESYNVGSATELLTRSERVILAAIKPSSLRFVWRKGLAGDWVAHSGSIKERRCRIAGQNSYSG